MSIVAVSPHLDDAALSASAALGAGGATIVTVFTALPAPDRPASWWDRLTGATSSLERQRERLAEDAEAMWLLSARALHLGEAEALYRDGDPDLGRAVERLTEALARASQVWLPSAIGGHRDHAFARDAGLRAAVAAGHNEVMLYADFPYVIAYGWPSWVSGRTAHAYLDAAFWLADQIASSGLDAQSLTPVVTRLGPEQRALKTAVIAAYRSQAAALRLTQHDLDADPAKLDFELAWRMPLAAGSSGWVLVGPDRQSRHHPTE
jgi:LmbE family N-acetylglucosaminyl deacetylase